MSDPITDTLNQLADAAKGIKQNNKHTLPGFEIDFKADLKPLINELNDIKDAIGGLEDIFNDCVDKAVEQTIPELSAALDAAMESPSWPWDGGARDIVDTGALRDSKSISYNKVTNVLSIQYNEPYADLVQFGGYITSGYNPQVSIYIPPRPWIDAVLEGKNGIPRFPFQELVEQRALEIFNSLDLF